LYVTVSGGMYQYTFVRVYYIWFVQLM